MPKARSKSASPAPTRMRMVGSRLAELVEPRRKAFAKLDLDQDGKLSFEEWAVRTIDKFAEADADKSKTLTSAEYATTAPKPRPKKPACACG